MTNPTRANTPKKKRKIKPKPTQSPRNARPPPPNNNTKPNKVKSVSINASKCDARLKGDDLWQNARPASKSPVTLAFFGPPA
jgi:hypothetical protein